MDGLSISHVPDAKAGQEDQRVDGHGHHVGLAVLHGAHGCEERRRTESGRSGIRSREFVAAFAFLIICPPSHLCGRAAQPGTGGVNRQSPPPSYG